MADPSIFRHYQIVQDAGGTNVELARNSEQVAVLAFDRDRCEFVNCHVLLHPLDNRTSFEQACKALQRDGHPLFARLLDYGEDDGNPFYITGNVDGETLRTYFQRQQDLPVWLAVMIAGRALDSALALAERGDFLMENALDTFRIVQVGSSALQVIAADYRVVERAGKNKARLVKANFERQGNFLRAFLQEKAGGGSGPVLPETLVTSMDFAELLGAVLGGGGPELVDAMSEVRTALRKLIPDHLAGEIPTTHKPRALIAPLLASYQDVARAVVNLVRIQSQRLDMSNPYAMRGTLTRAGRPVMVEQVPPAHLAGRTVLDFLLAAQKAGKKRDINALLGVPLVNDIKTGITCMAEDIVEGIALSELLATRGSLLVNETYLVLAGLDAALTQLEASRLPTRKLRLEDVLLITGVAREDARSARLLEAKLNEWPSFHIMLRAHPTLASMSGRGLDAGVFMPPALTGNTNLWHGGWLACVAKFLLGTVTSDSATQREREGVLSLVADELGRARDGSPSTRSDFLARFARIIQHYDQVQSVPITVIPPSAQTGKKAGIGKSATRPMGASLPPATDMPAAKETPALPPVRETPAAEARPSVPLQPIAPATSQPLVTTAPAPTTVTTAAPSVPLQPGRPAVLPEPVVARALTSPLAAPASPEDPEGEKPTIGFAELLFQGGSESGPPPAPVHQQVVWGVGASAQMESGEVGGWDDEPADDIPGWLKTFVFIGGSLVLGAMIAHLRGEALWQQNRPVPVVAPTVVPAPAPSTPAKPSTTAAPATTAKPKTASTPTRLPVSGPPPSSTKPKARETPPATGTVAAGSTPSPAPAKPEPAPAPKPVVPASPPAPKPPVQVETPPVPVRRALEVPDDPLPSTPGGIQLSPGAPGKLPLPETSPPVPPAEGSGSVR